MSAFDPKRTLATRFCCDAQPLPLAEEIAAALPLSCDDAAMNFLQQRNALVLHASKCVIPTLHDPTARRAALQSPGLLKAFRPSTALKPAHRAGDFWEMPDLPQVFV